MTKTDEAVASYYALRPTNFHGLERLVVYQAVFNGTWETTLDIVLRPKDRTDTQRLALSFNGVRNLRYIPAPLNELYFSFIEIASVFERQWEGINYQVFESEQETDFSFVCRDFRASLFKVEG